MTARAGSPIPRDIDSPSAGPVLEVRNLDVSFPTEAGRVAAVRGLSFHVGAGEVLGIVGESGSGKSVSALATMGLLPPQARVSGSIRFRGTELLGSSDKVLSRVRGRRIAMVFQDPLSALTPIFTVGDQVAEALRIHDPGMSRATAAARSVELLDVVGIPHARERAGCFPHEFSGGMRQRVVIAMAIANDPDLIIADEPTTALDVTVQAQVIDVLRTAKEITGAGIVLITHDLGVVAGFADRVMVMYAGRAVEQGGIDEVFARPRMPYTLGLLGSVPRLDAGRHRAGGRARPLVPIEGQPPQMTDLPPGCPFEPRCPMRVDRCRTDEPDLDSTGPAALHLAACWRSTDVGLLDAAAVFGGSTAGGAGTQPGNRTGAETGPLPAEGSGRWNGIPASNGARTGKCSASPHGAVPGGSAVGRADRPRVLDVVELVKHYPVTSGSIFRRRVGTVHAVDGISFDIRAGEVLGLVGESGCGKTTTLMEILGLEAPMGGRIEVLGCDVAGLDRRGRTAVRRDLQVVFQDPVSSLDPRLPVGDVIGEPLAVHGFTRPEIRRRVAELLALVGLRPDHANRYPAEFSGGQRQRIGIARALALEPKVLVLDEPVSALDVSIRAGVVNLLDNLRARLGLAFLFVAHDLSVIRHVADRVAVMYLGKIVEIGAVEAIYTGPRHPYTQALLSAIPIPDPEVERRRVRILLHGEQPSPVNPPSGCRFRTRCPRHLELTAAQRRTCVDVEPPRTPFGTDHEAACHFAGVREVVGTDTERVTT